MSSFLEKIGHFFVGLFNAAKKAYKNLSFQNQQALQFGAGLINLINEMADSSAADIRAAIKQKFPELDEAKLESALFEILRTFKLTQASDIEGAINEIKSHLSSLQGKGWAIASHAAASILAAAFGDPATKVAVFVSLIEWVYQTFIKKSV